MKPDKQSFSYNDMLLNPHPKRVKGPKKKNWIIRFHEGFLHWWNT